MIPSPGKAITDAAVSGRVPPAAPRANPHVMLTATVSPGPRPQRCTRALTAASRVPPDQPEDTHW
jgi:hypothetical protein